MFLCLIFNFGFKDVFNLLKISLLSPKFLIIYYITFFIEVFNEFNRFYKKNKIPIIFIKLNFLRIKVKFIIKYKKFRYMKDFYVIYLY